MTTMIQIPPELEGEYIIRVMDMPECLNGMVKYDENDFASIYVNAKLNAEARQKAADHELTHVINNDIHNDDPIEVIESRADAHATPRHRLPKLFKASDLLPSAQLPHRSGEVAERSEVDRAPRSPVPQLSPHQGAVLLRAISDLDDWLFRDTTCDL
jgi:hypothetical protein